MTPTPLNHAYQGERLENAERAREYALRMLGRLPLEMGLDEHDPNDAA